MNHEAQRATPAVVFVDDGPWECFFQLAALLRKSKIRTVRITAGPSGSRAERIIFDRNVSLPFPPSPEQLAAVLQSEYVLDVQPSDSLAKVTYAAVNLIPATQRSDMWDGRSLLLDKWNVTDTLRTHGLRTPETILVQACSPVDAAAKLSFPILVKRRVGSAGTGVRVFESIESLDEFVRTIETPSDWFFERFIQGRSMVCASYVGDDGVVVITTYEILTRMDPLGPSVMVEIQNDLTLLEIGNVLVDALQVRGFICFDTIRDANDNDWIHDVNVRVFGTFATCQVAGIDFFGAYVDRLLGRIDVKTQTLETLGFQAFLFPNGRKNVYRSGKFRAAPIRTLNWFLSYARLLGLRYLICLTLRVLSASLKRRYHRLRFGFRAG